MCWLSVQTLWTLSGSRGSRSLVGGLGSVLVFAALLLTRAAENMLQVINNCRFCPVGPLITFDPVVEPLVLPVI